MVFVIWFFTAKSFHFHNEKLVSYMPFNEGLAPRKKCKVNINFCQRFFACMVLFVLVFIKSVRAVFVCHESI